MPVRLQRKRSKGWTTPRCSCGCGHKAIYVGRPSRFGNPFTIGGSIPDMPNIYGPVSGIDNATAEQVVEAFRRYAPVVFVPIKPTARPYRGIYTHGCESLPQHAKRILRGHDLACWCPIVDEHGNRVPCHANVLLERSNR